MTALLILILAAPARAADPAWTIAAATQALVGEETVVGYRTSIPPGARLECDALSASTTDFVVVRAGFDPKASAWTWTLLPLREGRLSFAARWNLDGRPLQAPDVELSVVTPDQQPEADLRDIKPPREARPALWPWLLAGLLAAGSWLAWRRWRSRLAPPKPPVPAAPPPSPEQAALLALAQLAASGLWERGEHATYYLRLTDILREYLQARYGEPATAMTSAEVSRLVRSRRADLSLSASVRDVLTRADLVKFARLKPARNEGPRDADMVAALVRATT